MSALALYALTLGTTLAVEGSLAALCAPRTRARSVLAVALLANLVSHPTGTAVLALGGPGFWPVELGVLLLEALALHALAGLSWRRAGGLALLANAATAALALAWPVP